MAGINRATASSRRYSLESVSESKPCVFLSHISVDKTAVRKIGEYIRVNGDIDIYLDENDAELQKAVDDEDPIGITNFIDRGIVESTHLMCIVSEKTVNSWWVPYEIGYAKKSSKRLATLKLKGDVYLPDFLKITEILHGTKSLNSYVKEITGRPIFDSASSYSMEGMLSHSMRNHPLDNYLDWNQ